MKMPFLLISPKIVPKIQLIKKGGCFEYHAVIADKIKYRYVHRASICPALGMDRRSFFMPKTMGKYKRLEVFYLSKPVYAADKPSDCHYPYDSEMLDNILELIVETVCTKRPLIRIGAEERPTEIVRSRFMKLNAEHIRYVMDCFKENTTKIRNIRQYMLTTIYNAPTTIDTYYDALVRHDMSHGYLEGGFKKLKMKREEGE